MIIRRARYGNGLTWSLGLILGVALVACGTEPGSGSDEPGPIKPVFDAAMVEASVDAALGRFRAALQAADYETVIAAYADDERFFWVEDGAIRYTSRDEVRAALGQVQQFGTATYEFENPRIEVLDQDHAMVYTEVETTFGVPEAGGFSFAVAQTILMARINGEWVFLNGHSSSPRQR